jgi:hypothetical protein
MSEIRSLKMCGLFKPGHDPHWIQMSRATADKENLPYSGRLVESRSDGTVVIQVDERQLNLWNHEPERLAEVVAASGGIIEYQSRWGVLWVPNGTGKYAFSVASAGQVDCPGSQPLGTQAELLLSAGGFNFSLNEA